MKYYITASAVMALCALIAACEPAGPRPVGERLVSEGPDAHGVVCYRWANQGSISCVQVQEGK